MSIKRTPSKPTPPQVIRRLILVVFGWAWRAALCLVLGLTVGASLVGMFLVGSLFWMPWPEDWFIEVLLYVGISLWVCVLAVVLVKLYYFAYKIELKKRGLF